MLNMAGFLDPTLKCIDKFRLTQWIIASAIYMSKVSKKNTKTTCQIYLKLTIKTPRQCFYSQLWTYFALHSTVNIAEFKQMSVGPEKW